MFNAIPPSMMTMMTIMTMNNINNFNPLILNKKLENMIIYQLSRLN